MKYKTIKQKNKKTKNYPLNPIVYYVPSYFC
jgi:hypothetical protein